MTTLPIIRSDADWQRMSWRAKQQWLHAADKRRRALLVEVERATHDQAVQSIVAQMAMAAGIDPAHYDVKRSLDLAREIRSHLPDDPDGPEHLAALDPRAGDTTKADAYRARNAERQRKAQGRAESIVSGYVLPIDDRLLIAEFDVPGEPVSKSRARFTKRGSKVHTYTPKRTLDGERAVASAYRSATSAGPTDDEDAYRVEAEFRCGTRQRRDVDNMLKLILDGLNEVAWHDDNQVIEVEGRKSFVAKGDAGTTVRVYLVGRLNRPVSACIRCGNTFRTYDSWANNPNGKKYCSPECAYRHRVERKQRTCQQCGAGFQAHGESKPTKFCSRECADLSKRATVSCDCCGVQFTKQKCHVRAANYCSSDCMVKARSQRRKSRFRGTCQVCGGGVTRKEYVRCNPCKLAGAQPSGDPKPVPAEGSA